LTTNIRLGQNTGPLKPKTGPLAKPADAKPQAARPRTGALGTGDLSHAKPAEHHAAVVHAVDVEHIDLGAHGAPAAHGAHGAHGEHEEEGIAAEAAHLTQETAHQSTTTLKGGLTGAAKLTSRVAAGLDVVGDSPRLKPTHAAKAGSLAQKSKSLSARAAAAAHKLEHNPKFQIAEKGIGMAGVAAAGYELVSALREKPMNTQKALKELGHMAVSAELLKDAAFVAKVPGLKFLLAKIGGPGAIVAGIQEFRETLEKAHKEGWNAQKIASAIGSGASAVGGLFQTLALIPTPASPALEALAGGCYLIGAGAALTSTAIAHKDQIAKFVKDHGAEIAFPPLGAAKLLYAHRADIKHAAGAARNAVASTWNKATGALHNVEAQATSMLNRLVGVPNWGR
jgi:hypothetical protein